jgi:DNA primase
VPSQWIDFNQLKQELSFPAVFAHYDVRLTIKSDQATGLCPLPGHEDEVKPSFSASITKKIWQCFGCKAKGNILDFAVLMEGKNPKEPRDVRAVALTLLPLLKQENGTKRETPQRKPSRRRTSESPAPVGRTTVQVNEPLDFTLQDLNVSHPYLKKRGLSQKTIAHFGLGFCSRGLMTDRIAIPLHDEPHGRLI